MTGDRDDDDAPKKPPAVVVGFPFSRVAPSRSTGPEEPEVYGALATMLGVPHDQTSGHWCSRCARIWYGYLLEVECPVCGNRHG